MKHSSSAYNKSRKSRILHLMKNTFDLHYLIISLALLAASCSNPNASSDLPPETAEEVAYAIEKAIHKQDWDQTKWIHWVFPGPRKHLWDRERNFSEVKWDNYRAVINVSTQTGKVFKDNQLMEGPLKDSLMQKAWSAFINDAFWLNAPAKLFDDGTKRSLVEREGKTYLKVEYPTGGVTPGDYYIWHYDENYLPTAWEMYVSVISTPGVLSTWENWITLESGALIAINHLRGDRMMEITEVESGNSYKDFGREEDPFGNLD